MDKNTIIGFLLIGIVLIVFTWLNQPTPEQIEAYTTVGGTPHLDGEYTVFGEVVEGRDVVDKIQKVKTDRSDRPEEDVNIIKATILD